MGLALNNLQRLISHKTKPKPNIYLIDNDHRQCTTPYNFGIPIGNWWLQASNKLFCKTTLLDNNLQKRSFF